MGISSNLDKVSSNGALRRAHDLLSLTPYLWGITDQDSTRYIPGNISEEVMKVNTAAGISLAQYFRASDFYLAYRQSLEGAIKHLKKAPPVLRFLLTEMIRYNQYDSYWPSELKLDLIDEIVGSGQIENSIFLMERTRIFFKSLASVDRRSALRFNALADHLGIKRIAVPPEDDSFSYRSKRVNWIPRNNIKDIMKSYRSLTHEQKMEVEETVIANLQNFVDDLQIEELDELTSFVLEEPLLEYKSANLLENTATRYERLGSSKWLEVLVKSFEVGYGWLYGWGEEKVSWLSPIKGTNQ